MLKIIETHEDLLNDVLEKQAGRYGIYGGVGYKPFKPLKSEFQLGLNFNF
ncbi:MAG: hypothetical protein ACOCRX_12150 [Candidatus Woesearchaeota archaeon]